MARGAEPSERTPTTGSQPVDEADTKLQSASTDAVDEALKTRAMDEAPVGITIADATKPDQPLVYANAAFERITGYPPTYAVGRNCRFLQGEATREKPVRRMRAAIEEERATTVVLRNYRRNGEQFWNEVTIAPLRDESGAVAYYVGFQQDVTRRKRAEQAAANRAERIERERTAQERLLDRLDGVVADVTESVTRATSRAELERGVTQSIADTYAGAWLGTYDPASETVVPEVCAGVVDPDVVGRQFSVAESTATPAAEIEAVETAVAGALDAQYVHIEPIERAGVEASAVAGVPLHFGTATYGAVAVYVATEDFHTHERAVLTALGRTVATGINAIESRRTRHGEEVIEVQLGVEAHPVVALASALDCRLRYVGTVGDREVTSLLFEVGDGDGLDAEAVRAAAARRGVTIHAVLATETDVPVVELSVDDGSFRALLADHSGEVTEWTAEAGLARVTVEVGREPLAQSFADTALEQFEAAELIGYRRRERRAETQREFVADLRSRLTDRQHAALVRAYTTGYFEWPHETSGDEIAESMGVCRSTFHQHLRAAQRKLAAAVLEG
ncbi:PAS domain S-box protein [Halobellus rufus]|uniref:PAS domain S-box protein n=1 Tax=Halobellus rufus TaxID=1448860 RepID=UPI000678F4BB|nr:PAS domain-containing protein [Halobellus rufus]